MRAPQMLAWQDTAHTNGGIRRAVRFITGVLRSLGRHIRTNVLIALDDRDAVPVVRYDWLPGLLTAGIVAFEDRQQVA